MGEILTNTTERRVFDGPLSPDISSICQDR